MNCPEEKTIGMLVDGVLPEAERTELFEHIKKCAQCGRVHAEIIRINELAKTSFSCPEGRYLDELTLKIKERYEKDSDSPRVRNSGAAVEIFWGVIQAAALFLIACAVAFVLFASKPSASGGGLKDIEPGIATRIAVQPEKPIADILKEKERTMTKLL